jgi:hypothetical protein
MLSFLNSFTKKTEVPNHPLKKELQTVLSTSIDSRDKKPYVLYGKTAESTEWKKIEKDNVKTLNDCESFFISDDPLANSSNITDPSRHLAHLSIDKQSSSLTISKKYPSRADILGEKLQDSAPTLSKLLTSKYKEHIQLKKKQTFKKNSIFSVCFASCDEDDTPEQTSLIKIKNL